MVRRLRSGSGLTQNPSNVQQLQVPTAMHARKSSINRLRPSTPGLCTGYAYALAVYVHIYHACCPVATLLRPCKLWDPTLCCRSLQLTVAPFRHCILSLTLHMLRVCLCYIYICTCMPACECPPPHTHIYIHTYIHIYIYCACMHMYIYIYNVSYSRTN